MKPVVTVVVNCYNSDRRDLSRAIDSVLTQTCANIEVLVVDDGSDIPFADLTEFYGDRKNLRWIRLESNRGIGAARNVGLSQARGHYICYLDQDDWWQPEKIEKQLDVISETGVGWVCCAAIRHRPNDNKLLVNPACHGNVFKSLLKEQIIPGSVSSVMMRREVLRALGGFSENRNIVEDWDLWIRFAREHEIAYVAEPLVHLSGSAGSSRSKNIEARLERLRGTIDRHSDLLQDHQLLDYARARYYRVRARLYQKAGQFPSAFAAWMAYLLRSPGQRALRGILSTLLFTLPKWLLAQGPGLGSR